MSKIPAQAIKVGRPLTRNEVELPNGILLVAVPLAKTKGRHWIAQRRRAGTTEYETIGEFKSWQQSKYTRPTSDEEVGTLRSVQQFRSWIIDSDKLDIKRKYKEWEEELKSLRHDLNV